MHKQQSKQTNIKQYIIYSKSIQKKMTFTRNKVAPDNDNAEYSQNVVEDEINIQTMMVCRICLEQDRDLVNPCICTGSIAMVHQNCIISWLNTQLSRDPKYRIRCQICLQKIHYVSAYQIKFKPAKFCQKLDDIHSCSLILIFFSIVSISILSVVIFYKKSDLDYGIAKPIVISALVAVVLIFVANLIYVFLTVFTERIMKIVKILDRKQIGKNNTHQNQSAQSFTSSRSSIQYRSDIN